MTTTITCSSCGDKLTITYEGHECELELAWVIRNETGWSVYHERSTKTYCPACLPELCGKTQKHPSLPKKVQEQEGLFR